MWRALFFWKGLKMKKKKEKILDSLLEGVIEFILAIILFAVGFLVCLVVSSVFSVDITELDFDWFVLIGIIFLAVIIAVISFAKRSFKSKDKHHMKLHSSPFEKIKSGEKTIELRLFDEKRQRIKVGDRIVFTNTDSGKSLWVTVVKLHRFDSFAQLYEALPLLQCGYTAEDVDKAHPSDMEAYYSVEEQKKYGVVGIEIQVN